MAVLVGGVTGSVPVFAMGLTVSGLLIGPLNLLTGTMLATLSAGWVANLASAYNTAGFAQVRTRSRLGAIFCMSSVSASVAFVLGYAANAAVFWLGLSTEFLPVVFTACGFAFVVATAIATWRLRSPVGDLLSPTGTISLTLSVAWLIFLSAFGGIADLLGMVPVDLATGFPLATLFIASVAVAGAGVLLGVAGGRRSSETRTAQSRGLDQDAALMLFLTGIAPVCLMVAILLGCSVVTCGA